MIKSKTNSIKDTVNNLPKYDVALSFAGEQRDYVREVAKVLANDYELKVFFDEFEEEVLWGGNLYEELHEIYSKKAKYVIIFISSEYKEKVWTNHEKSAAQEKALQLKNKSYILPVKFDETQIPGLPTTTFYLDAKKYSPYQIALKFIQKIKKSIKVRWFGEWAREQFSKTVTGDLEILKIDEKGFYFNILVNHGAHSGHLDNQYAKFTNNYEAISEIDECKLKFVMLNYKLYVQEERHCRQHLGMRAYFEGRYTLKKDFFYMFDKIDDKKLSSLYEVLGNKCFANYEMCFSDYSEIEDNKKYILHGSVPGLPFCYSGCLILDEDEIRGCFVNCYIEDEVIFWFATDNKKDRFVDQWANDMFNNQYKLKKFKRDICQDIEKKAQDRLEKKLRQLHQELLKDCRKI